MKLDWLEMRLISFTWCTSLICLERASTASCLCSAASVKVKPDEIWTLNFYWLASPEALVACLNEKVWQEEAGQKRARGFEWGCNLRQRKTYIHGNVPGHVDVGFVFVHPNLSGSQGIALGVVIYVIVVGFFGALDMGHSGAREDFHAPTTLPHLHSRKKEFRSTATHLLM